MKLNKFFSVFDFVLFFSVIILSFIGLVFIYSANLKNIGSYTNISLLLFKINLPTNLIKQLFFFIAGLSFLILTQFFSLRKIKNFGVILYVICIFGLVATLFFSMVKGQKRFDLGFVSIQFSEIMKIAVIMVLSDFLTKRTKEELASITILLKSLAICFFPVGLIMLQPDLGSALVYIPIYLTISYFAGVNIKYLLFLTLTGFFSSVIPILTTLNKLYYNNENDFLLVFENPTYIVIFFSGLIISLLVALIGQTNVIKGISFRIKKIFFIYSFFCSLLILGFAFSYFLNYKVLADYQKDRILIFFNPEADPQFRGYHIIQSKTAIGNGGMLGKGWAKGVMSQNDFLPERDTDFIYPVIAEEMGFIGSLFILLLYSLLIFRCFMAIMNSRTYWGAFVILGILSMYIFHILQNMGMCLGIMPITGIPLPFISYGGTFLVTSIISAGIIIKIQIDRFEY